MTSTRERATRLQTAWTLGSKGAAVPNWVENDPQYLAAFLDGQHGYPKPAPPEPTPKPAKPAPAAPAPKTVPAPGGQSNPIMDRPSPTAVGTVSRAMSSDAGGLLLALVLYPLLLAVIQHGAAGPGLWFRAKWLNQTSATTTTSTTKTKTTAAGTSGPVDPKTGKVDIIPVLPSARMPR